MSVPMLDFTTSRSKVRLLISDVDLAAPIFVDSAIDTFLELNDDNIKRAAAQALTVIAVNEVLVQKRIRLLDLSTDGPGEAQALKELAAQLRLEADHEESGNLDFLPLPPDIDRFDRRTNGQWSSLQEERDIWL